MTTYSVNELIDLIESADMEELCGLGIAVKSKALELTQSGNLEDALSVMGCYTEVEWDDYPGADGFWQEHEDIAEILLLLGERVRLENPNLVIKNSTQSFPYFYRFGATINPNLKDDAIAEWIEASFQEDTYASGILRLGLFFNENLNFETFVKYFERLNAHDINYILDIALGHPIYDGSDQFAFEFLSKAENSLLGRKRVISYISDKKDEFVTQVVRFADLEVGSKEEFQNRWSDVEAQ